MVAIRFDARAVRYLERAPQQRADTQYSEDAIDLFLSVGQITKACKVPNAGSEGAIFGGCLTRAVRLPIGDE